MKNTRKKHSYYLVHYRINGVWLPQYPAHSTHAAADAQGQRAYKILNIDGYKVTPL